MAGKSGREEHCRFSMPPPSALSCCSRRRFLARRPVLCRSLPATASTAAEDDKEGQVEEEGEDGVVAAGPSRKVTRWACSMRR